MRLSQYILTPIFLIISSISLAMEPPETKYFMVTDQCCGEDSDPHAVHGIAVEENGYILSGKSVDNEESHDGFVVKFPYLKNEEGNIWLHPEDDFNIEWTYIFGSDGKLDALSISTPYKAMASHHALEPNSPTGLILLISSETMVLPLLLFFPLSPVED